MRRYAQILAASLATLGAKEAVADETPRDSYEQAAMVGFASASDYLGTGPLFAFELGGRRQLDDFSVGVALRIQYEQFGSDRIGACSASPPPLAGPCGPDIKAFDFTLDETLLTFEVPLTARLGAASGTMLPYAGVAPGLLYDRADLAATVGQSHSTETSGRLSLHGFAGTQLRVGPGGLFVEWGFRVSPVEHRAEGESTLTSFTGAVGYRLTL
jgi:hypothetical protein